MSCEVKYNKDGSIDHVIQDGKRAVVYDAIRNLISSPIKALTIFNQYVNFPNVINKFNLDKVTRPTEISIEKTSTEQVSDIYFSAVKKKRDLGIARVNNYRRTSEVDLQGVQDITMANMLGRVRPEIKAIAKRLAKEEDQAWQDKVQIDTEIKIVQSSSNEGVRFDIYTKEVKLAEIRLTQKENGIYELNYPEVISNVEGQGLGRYIMAQAIESSVQSGREVVIPSLLVNEAKDFFQGYIDAGAIIETNQGYQISNQNKGTVEDAIRSSTTSTEALGAQYRPYLNNLMLSLGVTNTNALRTKLKPLDKGGVLSFDKLTLRKVFTGFEADNISMDENAQQQITDVYKRLHNTEYSIPEFDSDFVRPIGMETFTGIREMTNPYVEELRVAKAVAGQTDVMESLPEEYLDKYQKDNNFKQKIDYYQKNYGNIPVYSIVGNSLEDLDNETISRMRILYSKPEITSRVTEMIDEIEEFHYYDQISKIHDTLEEALIELGFELPQNVIGTASDEEISAIVNMLYAVRDQQFEEATRLYEVVKKGEKATKLAYGAKNSTDIYLETDAPVDILMDEFSLLQVDENVYRRVNPEVTGYDLAEAISSDTTVNYNNLEGEEFINFLVKKANNEGITKGTRESILKQYLFKRSEGIYYTPSNLESQTKVLTEANLDIEYFKEDFLLDIAEYATAENNLKITERGLEFIYSDPISITNALESIPEDVRDAIIEYSQISKFMEAITDEFSDDNFNTSDTFSELMNKGITDVEMTFYDSFTDSRIEAYNYPRSVKQLTKPYNTVENSNETILVVRGEAEAFLNVDGNVAELVGRIGDTSLFKIGPQVSQSHIIESLIEPVELITDIEEFSQFTQTSGEAEIKTDIFQKGELEKINKQNFEC